VEHERLGPFDRAPEAPADRPVVEQVDLPLEERRALPERQDPDRGFDRGSRLADGGERSGGQAAALLAPEALPIEQARRDLEQSAPLACAGRKAPLDEEEA
jgi:hypothetical protein